MAVVKGLGKERTTNGADGFDRSKSSDRDLDPEDRKEK